MIIPPPQAVELDGGRQATYRAFGSGPPLFFFVGGPGFPAMLQLPDALILQERFAVHLVDPHGSGGSSPPADPGAYDHLGHARFYDEVRRALGLERVSIGGESFGGVMAITYSAMYPEVVERCVAVSVFALGEDVSGEDTEEELERNLSRHADAPWYPEARQTLHEWTERVLATEDPAEVDAMFRQVFPLYMAEPDRPDVRAMIERVDPFVVSDLAAMKAWESGLYQTIDLRPLLSQVRCPTLVIAGEFDFLCGPTHARVIAEGVDGADLVILENCGHTPAMETPDTYRRAIFDWLDRVSPSADGP